ncbi:MAG: prolyl oligopeptidase family serine peptidase [Cyclobacteriaceae bacterium]|jgi:dipeptidyl aminopeptidase/acylaminoacyl peptidase|nr:prolyl oligopeptidase family serine peptidase [Cyclobacteriaceae bacterium]
MKMYVVLALVALAPLAVAQKKSLPPVAKKPLTHAVYDGWKEIPYKQLTPNGEVAAVTINPQEGDGKIVFYHLKTNAQDSTKRAAEIALTYDSRHAIFKIKPPQKLVKELRRQKKKKEDLPKDSLGIYTISTRKTEKIAGVKSYKIAEKSGQWLAYQLEPKKEAPKPKDEKTNPGETKKPAKKVKPNNDDNGYTLVLRNLITRQEQAFGYVRDYLLAKEGQGLLFATAGNDSTLKPGVYWYDGAKLQSLYEGKSKFKYKGLSVYENGTQAVFLVDTDTTKALVRQFKLFWWRKEMAQAHQLPVEEQLGIPINWMVSEHYTPNFSKDGNKLFFGAAPKPVVADTTLLPEEIVNVEVWTGDDDYIYPQQNRQLENEKKRSYLMALDLSQDRKSVWQAGSPETPNIVWGDEGNASVALAETDVNYRKMITWDTQNFSDVYLYDFAQGLKKKIAVKLKGNAALSPKARFVYWYSLADTAWFSYSIAQDKIVPLTASLPVAFADEEDDHPDYPSPYGSAGWIKNDEAFIAYDRYDLWKLDPLGVQPATNLTRIGRTEKIRFRYLRLDAEERFIDPDKELLLSAFHETTKQAGYYKLNLKDGKLTKLLMSDQRYAFTAKAKQANQLLFTRESFREYPDVWTTDLSFTAPKKLTEVNPQMKNYLWGSVERVRWISLDNIPLEGLLYKPEGFDPKKKYPTMVYFYEKYADDIHQHHAPAPIRSFINFSLYASNGYVVFVPDVVYKIGFPGESAHNCILPGVTSLIEKGFVDEKRIGIQGHSWGGYQTAYLVTRTNLFAAAEAGAPVVNMISAYGGVRWESGLSRMFQYEKSQSRLGGTLWEKPMLYIENSPIFFADKVQTPLLMMHNDADGAVPWYQGIEYYMALRRLNKPVWMLNYNGQGHGLTQRQDRTDFAIRMMQFFDHYLKGTPMPTWMKEGVPAVEKGITKGY